MSSVAESAVPSEESGAISRKLMITMVSCILAFLAITIGFLFVARKKRRTSPSPAPAQSLPLTHTPRDHCPNHYQPARRGIALPVVSANTCPTYSKAFGKASEASRASHETLRSPAPHTRYAPTGVSVVRPESWRSAASAPTTPPSPPPAYMARGPTASFRRVVY